jgi:hypothetical protein
MERFSEKLLTQAKIRVTRWRYVWIYKTGVAVAVAKECHQRLVV